MPDELRVIVAGLGTVGRAVVGRLDEVPGARLVGVADSSGILTAQDGLDATEVLSGKRNGGLRGYGDSGVFRPGATEDLLESVEADVFVELLPADYAKEGGVGRRLIESALHGGLDAVTADKAPLACAWQEVWNAARLTDRRLGFNATVGGGKAVIPAVLASPDAVRWIEGTLNGTTNHVLSLAERGRSLEEAVRVAQSAGLAEADPRVDLDGLDAAAKGVILHNVCFPTRVSLRDAVREVLDNDVVQRARSAYSAGRRLRALTRVEAGKVEVRFTELTSDHALAQSGPTTGLIVRRRIGTATEFIQAGRGGPATADAVLADLAALCVGAAPTPAR